MRFYQGFYKPFHPGKYKGNPTNIVFRSSWELKFMLQFDRDKNVEQWQSEEFYIPYYDPTRSMVGHYYPDFKVKYKDGRTVIYEIKPFSQTILKENAKLKEKLLFEKNSAKWKAAIEYCKKRNYEFKIITEKDFMKK